MEKFLSFSFSGNKAIQESSRQFASSQECQKYLDSVIMDSEKYAREAYFSACQIKIID